MNRGRTTALALGIVTAFALCVSATASAAILSQTDSLINRTTRSRNAIAIDLGRSAEGRPLHGVVVTDSNIPLNRKARVLIIAGQHGNETNPCDAVSHLAAEWATDAAFDRLRRGAMVVFVPAVNPDGLARGTRFDSTGADLNRDWERLDRPETRAVTALIEQWKPHALIDVHEWTDARRNEPNSVEISQDCANPALFEAARRIRYSSLEGGFTAVDSHPGRSAALFHRHFARAGYAAFLLETSAGIPAAEKNELYRAAIVCIVKSTLDEKAAVEACSLSGTAFSLPGSVVAWHDKTPKATDEPFDAANVMLGVCGVACSCLLLAGAQKKHHPAKWLRQLRRCAASDVGLTYTPRGLLPDLTSRSWVNRRLRSGHTVSTRAGV